MYRFVLIDGPGRQRGSVTPGYRILAEVEAHGLKTHSQTMANKILLLEYKKVEVMVKVNECEMGKEFNMILLIRWNKGQRVCIDILLLIQWKKGQRVCWSISLRERFKLKTNKHTAFKVSFHL
jgi:hypothetical protein